jgi:hypothetical protein
LELVGSRVVSSGIGAWETDARLVRARESSGRVRDIILAVQRVKCRPRTSVMKDRGALHYRTSLPNSVTVMYNLFLSAFYRSL